MGISWDETAKGVLEKGSVNVEKIVNDPLLCLTRYLITYSKIMARLIMKGWTPKLKSVDEESAGNSCDVAKRIFEGRVLDAEDDAGLLMRFRA